MIKNVLILFCGLFLFGCSSTIRTQGGFENINKDLGVGAENSFNVAVLLPTTGDYATVGKGMRNAAQMALEDAKNKNLVLRFYDTQSTQKGARIAIENALSYNPDLVVGPLLSDNVDAISGKLSWRNIPMVSFATNPDVLEENVYSIGLMSENQVNRMFEYAYALGKTKFALLLPDNKTGQAVFEAANNSAEKQGAEIIKTTFYPQNTTDFSLILKEMTDYVERKKLMDAYKEGLEAQALLGDINAQRELKTLGETDAMTGVEFDAVLIADGGARLKSALSMFGYYDVSQPEVLFFGTSIWEGSDLNNEENAIGGMYPSLSRQYSGYFNSKYKSVFNQNPSTLFALAYDAIALASRLSRAEDVKTALLKQDGYAGLNGVFRFLPNGQSEHVLDIYQVNKNGDVIIDKAPKSFQ